MEGDDEIEKGPTVTETTGESSNSSSNNTNDANKGDVVVKIGLVGDAQVRNISQTPTSTTLSVNYLQYIMHRLVKPH